MHEGITNEAIPEGGIPPRREYKEQKPEAFTPVRLQGELVPGPMRGADLMKRVSDRLVSVIGFRPFLGTLDVQVGKLIDMQLYETKRISHVLMDGSEWVDLRLAPAKLIVTKGVSGGNFSKADNTKTIADEFKKQIIAEQASQGLSSSPTSHEMSAAIQNKNAQPSSPTSQTVSTNEQKPEEGQYQPELISIDCWMARDEMGLHDPGVIELISAEQLTKKLGIGLGSKVEVELYERKLSIFDRVRRALHILPPRVRLVK